MNAMTLQAATVAFIAARHGNAHSLNIATHDWNPDPALRRVGTYCRACKCAEDSMDARKPCNTKPSQGKT